MARCRHTARGRIALGAAIGALALLSLPSSAAAAVHSLASGPLEVRVEADPFRLSFVDRGDGDVLRSVGGALPSPDDPRARYGPLGYSFDLRLPVVNNAFFGYYAAAEVETVWFHATRVRSARRDGDALLLDLATNDPLGHRLELRIEPQGSGGLTLTSRVHAGVIPQLASVSGAGFEAAAGERFLGFGERSNAADQTGNRVFSWAEEGPFSAGNYEPILRTLIPDFTFPSGPTATNLPIPWTVTTRGFGLLIDQTHRSTFRLASDRADAWHAEAEANRLRLTVFAGPRPAEALRRYSAYAGRQPRPADWIFGPWYQPTLETRPYEIADLFRAADVPVSVAQTYTHYLPCGAHVGRREEERARTAGYHARGQRVTTYFNPHVCTSYEPAYSHGAANDYFVRNALGEPYLLTNPFTADQIVSEVDFTMPAAKRWWQGLLDEAIDDGYDGWMEDFGEYTPTDSRFADGRGGLEMHNRYPVLYHCASYEHTRERMGREAAVYVRSGFHGVQPCARVVWGGDPSEDWTCSDGLCAAVHQALSTGLSGIAYWGSDIGGFHAIVGPRTDDELNSRWLQFGAFSGVMRTQANGYSFTRDRSERSQVWHPDVLPIWRRYSKLRTQLLPYVEAASLDYQRRGMPLTRHLALDYPGDPRALRQQTEYMFGPDLLVAPVLSPGARERRLYLPRGRWVDLWRSARYRAGDGSLRLARPRVLSGARDITVPAPLEEIPILVRAGTLLPLLPANVDSLAGLGERAAGTDATERDARVILAWPRGRSEARIGNDGRISSVERRRKLRLRIASEKRRRFRIHASLATLKRPFRPCRVKIGKRRLAKRKWRFDRGRQVIDLRVRARNAKLTISGRCRARERPR